jgi:hypothetical protein
LTRHVGRRSAGASMARAMRIALGMTDFHPLRA